MFRFAPPLLGLFIFALGSGYLMTMVPLLVSSREGDGLLAGYLGGVYYLGLFAGSFRSERTVSRVGHIRSFAAFMALLCSSTLGLAITDSIPVWVVLRFLNGLAVAGIFVVVESWLLCESGQHNRGRILAIYMVALYGANAIGQLFIGFFPEGSPLAFVLIGLLFSLSIVPPSLARVPSPVLESAPGVNIIELFKLTPSAMLGCMMGGMVLGALYALLPVQLLAQTGSNETVGVLMAVTMAGGMLLQYPVGHFSDFVDRRKVLVAISAAGSLCCLMYMLLDGAGWLATGLLFLIGGTTFALYPIAISHGCDHMKPTDIVAGTQGLLLSYSLGSCIGPVVAGFFMHYLNGGLMLYFVLVMGLLTLFFLLRIPFRPAIVTGEDQAFVAVTRTTPVVAQIDPRNETTEHGHQK
ncbi:MFS transporter [Endozoicomonas sp. Mp262]|uniref:MFS transporter n=1 Tax=Endozoicomonas sp. Mp262 TaxID=2919499 RepID=UPI0021D8B056